MMDQNPAVHDVMRCWEHARKHYDDMYNTPDLKKIREVAIKFCEYDGHDPNMVVMGYARQPGQVGAKGNAIMFAPIQPSWVLYVKEAQLFFVLIEEMGFVQK